MEYQEYYDRAHGAARQMDAGDLHGALEGYHALVQSDISDLDKADMCHNMALICNQMGHLDEALAWYDEGITYEEPHFRGKIMEYKARMFIAHARYAEAIEILEYLRAQPYQTELDKFRFGHDIADLKAKAV